MSAPRDEPKSLKATLLTALDTRPGSELSVGGVPASLVAGALGTPIYVFDAEIMRRNFSKVRATLGSRVEVLFALKANPNCAVASVLREAGAACEVASAGEILVAMKAGFRGDQVQFAGPGKHGPDIELALQHGIFSLNLESISEYEAVRDAAKRSGVRQGVAVRVNPKDSLGGSRMQMGGGSKKFGVDTELVPELIKRIAADGDCQFRGLHIYAGTQSFDAKAWAENARGIVTFANQVEAETGVPVNTINFGGGFGVPLFEGDAPFDIESVGPAIQGLIALDARPERKYFVELGRYLVANSGVYLTRVIYAKESAGKHHLILDGGMHHHAAAAGMGSLIRRPFPIVPVARPWAEPTTKFTLGGPLCTPADEFAANLDLPAVQVGDVLAVLASGAYGLTFSNTMFLSHPAPGEVLAEGGKYWLVREPGRTEDSLRGQRLKGELEPRE